jgi:hypothetical protein
VGFVIALVGSFLFGAVDQYLGGGWSLNHLGSWTTDVSVMSAPWLVLPFVLGSTQACPWRAAILGLGVTLAALLGYFVMTVSPLEGVDLATVRPLDFLHSQLHVIIPSLATGPLFGWLGQRWRMSRSWLSAALVAGAFSLEPLARAVDDQPFQFTGVAASEIIIGIAISMYFARAGMTGRVRGHDSA